MSSFASPLSTIFSGFQHVGTVRKGKRFLRILFNQKDCHAVCIDLADDIEDLIDIQRGQTPWTARP